MQDLELGATEYKINKAWLLTFKELQSGVAKKLINKDPRHIKVIRSVFFKHLKQELPFKTLDDFY